MGYPMCGRPLESCKRAWVGMGIGMGREGPMSVKRSSLPTRAGPLGQEKYFFEKTVDTFSNLWYSNGGSEMRQTKRGIVQW